MSGLGRRHEDGAVGASEGGFERSGIGVVPKTDVHAAFDQFRGHVGGAGDRDDVGRLSAALALVALGEGSHRFGELRRQVEGVCEKMLSQTLRALERDGMVTRTVVSTVPLRVDYALTDLGAQIATVLRGMADVLEDAVPDIASARQRYDSQPRRQAGRQAPPATPGRWPRLG